MADREVTKSHKDRDGDILALCHPDRNWSPRWKNDAINDIESQRHSYFVDVPGTGCVDIHVVQGSTGKYLRTDPDHTTHNNLKKLPDCFDDESCAE